MHATEPRSASATLGSALERDRLARRTRRMEYVLRALRTRAGEYERGATVPAPLHQAIAEFSRTLADDRRRLRTLTGRR
jgi:hypothetical protein